MSDGAAITPPPSGAQRSASPDRFDVLGVEITDMSTDGAMTLFESLISDPERRTRLVFYVNAHTLNVAATDPSYMRDLNDADFVFGDGTGVRWVVRMVHGHSLLGNVNGTDMTPALFKALAGRGLRYFLLGATPEVIERAAAHARRTFEGWTQVGYHHGYVDEDSSAAVVQAITEARPDLLLVGMGNPLQERWLIANKGRLDVPLCMGTGGLFTYWAGNLDRAPIWMRRIGIEWLHLLRRQPHKARRYVLGSPLFLARGLRQRLGRSRR